MKKRLFIPGVAFAKTRLTRKFPYINIFSLVVFFFAGGLNFGLKAQRLSRDLNVDLLVNQVGYTPNAGKFFVSKGKTPLNFEVIDLTTREVVFQGSLQPSPGDFGDYLSGDFSDLTQEGNYYIKADTLRSYPFQISNSVYQSAMESIVGYFAKQRCGASTSGYLSPCHLDDGVRLDNGKHQDVSGGWHDASDLRKWVGATIYGMIGLAKTYELQGEPYRNRILEELMWGNQYFLNMQEPEGYIMSFIGGDVKKHSDSNRWTDNEIGTGEGDLRLTTPSVGKSTHDMLIFGTMDDRVIQTDPLDFIGQYNFITSEALMARITASIDPDYSNTCLQAAIKAFEWCAGSRKDTTPAIVGAAIHASVELYKTTGDEKFRKFAIEQAAQLKQLQADDQGKNVNGFFYASTSEQVPYKDIWQGGLALISLCDLAKTFPLHPDVSSWKEMIGNYAHNYLLLMSGRNSFGIVPFGLFTQGDPGGNRKIDGYWYRYFMQPELEWWVGINSNIASAGIGLVQAAQILKDQELKILAQRQLDWILGVNPFNSSTLVGAGYNHPSHFGGSSFSPLTPVLPGAVLNGLGGDAADQPIIGDGIWQISEYWTPMVAHTLWLMAELSHDE